LLDFFLTGDSKEASTYKKTMLPLKVGGEPKPWHKLQGSTWKKKKSLRVWMYQQSADATQVFSDAPVKNQSLCVRTLRNDFNVV